MSDELNCKESKRKQGTCLGRAQHRLKPRARTLARAGAYDHAREAALRIANDYTCPDVDCPGIELTIRLGKPADDGDPVLGPIPGGIGWTCKATCYWSARVRCTREGVPTDSQFMAPAGEDLTCDDPPAKAWSGMKGTAESDNPDWCIAEANAEALAKALLIITDQIDTVNCDADCPHKKVIVLLSGPTGTCAPPDDKHDNYRCVSWYRWCVKVTCYD